MADWGLVDYWVKKTKPQKEGCSPDGRKAFSKARDDRKILSLNDLSGPFILLVTGSILSFFVFLLEKFCYFINQVTHLKSPPPIKTHEIDHSLADIDHPIVEMD